MSFRIRQRLVLVLGILSFSFHGRCRLRCVERIRKTNHWVLRSIT